MEVRPSMSEMVICLPRTQVAGCKMAPLVTGLPSQGVSSHVYERLA